MSPRAPRSFALLLVAVALVFALPMSAQVPPGCPNVCNHTYALCIAASCDSSGNCGACDKTDGSCGYCYVFQGESCSYGKSCSEVAPSGSTVYSTYSEVLAVSFGFQAMTCPKSAQASAADCMDGACTLTGSTVTLTDKSGKPHQVPTAICQCTIGKGGGATLGGQCNSSNCSSIWSTANPHFFKGPALCPASATTKSP